MFFSPKKPKKRKRDNNNNHLQESPKKNVSHKMHHEKLKEDFEKFRQKLTKLEGSIYLLFKNNLKKMKLYYLSVLIGFFFLAVTPVNYATSFEQLSNETTLTEKKLNSNLQNQQEFKKNSEKTIDILSTENAKLKLQLENIIAQIISLEQQMIKLQVMQEKNNDLFENKLIVIHPNLIDKLRYSFEAILSFIFQNRFLISTFIVLTVLLIYRKSLQSNNQSKTIENQNNSKGYDFLADNKNEITKLDLARVYLEMNDKETAQKLLKEVISTGDQPQQIEAQTLLESINS